MCIWSVTWFMSQYSHSVTQSCPYDGWRFSDVYFSPRHLYALCWRRPVCVYEKYANVIVILVPTFDPLCLPHAITTIPGRISVRSAVYLYRENKLGSTHILGGCESSSYFLELYSFHHRPHSIHWGRDKMTAIFSTTFSSAFSWIKMYKLNFDYDFTEVCSLGSN